MSNFNLTDFKISTTYTFSTNAPSILGESIKNAKLVAVMDYDTALKYDNIDVKYRTIYPVLVNSIDDPRSCIWYKFKSESGEDIIVADQWINVRTVEEVTFITLQITLNKVTTADNLLISNMLYAMGYTYFKIENKTLYPSGVL